MTRSLFRICTGLLWGCAIFTASSTVAIGQQTGNYWNSPRTSAEETLNRVLRLSESDHNLVEFLLQTPFYKAKKNKNYTIFFTKRLLSDMAAMERNTVQENCQGKYIKGELCGTDYNPLTCAQDTMNDYLFKTLSQTQNHARIEYRWPTEKKFTGRYDLKLEDGQWKIDHVTCAP